MDLENVRIVCSICGADIKGTQKSPPCDTIRQPCGACVARHVRATVEAQPNTEDTGCR